MHYEEEAVYDEAECVDDVTERPHGVRFGEGQPINRGGRPRGSPNIATMVRRVAFKRHRVKIDGRVRRKNTIELAVLAIRRKAAQQDVRAFNLMQLLLQKHAPRSPGLRGVLIIGERINEAEWAAIYDATMTDEQVMVQFPYLMRARKTFQENQVHIEILVREAENSGKGSTALRP